MFKIEKFKSLFNKRFTVNLGDTYSEITNYQILESLRRNYIRHGCDFVTLVDEKKLKIRNAPYSFSFSGSFWEGVWRGEITIEETGTKRNIVLEVNFMYKVLSRLLILLTFVVIILIVSWKEVAEAGSMVPGFFIFIIFVNLIGSAIQVSRFDANFKRTIKLAIKDWDNRNSDQ